MPFFPAITGATPIDDISGLLLPIQTQDELANAEAINIAKAITRYLVSQRSARSARFDRSGLIQLHEEMLGDVWAWAGTLRTTQFNIGVAAYRITEELQKMLDDLTVWSETEMDLIEQAARLHHRAVWIHPFSNGNGRWARLLADIWLKRNGSQPISWPSDVGQESPIREEYISAVRAADDGDFEPLLSLHQRFGSP